MGYASSRTPRSPRSPLWRLADRIVQHRPARRALVLLGALVLFGVLVPYLHWVGLADPIQIHLTDKFSLPSLQHWLGTDQLGRDTLARLLWGIRTSVWIALITMALTALIGITYGAIAALAPARLETLMMRLADALMSFPSEVMILALVGVMGPGVDSIIVACVVAEWPWHARMARTIVKKFTQLAYVESARVSGASDGYVFWQHLLPRAAGECLVLMSIDAGMVILMISSLSFLGLGLQPPTPEWGMMLAESKEVLTTHGWLAWAPGLAIMLTAAGFNALGDALRDALDARFTGPMRTHTVPATHVEPVTQTPIPYPSNDEGYLYVEHLTIRHRNANGEEALLVNGLSLTLNPGEVGVLLGESGAGKSISALALVDLLGPRFSVSGTIRLAGETLLASHVGGGVDRRSQHRGTDILYLVQNAMTAFHPLRRVGDELAEALRVAEPDLQEPAIRERLRAVCRSLRFEDPDRVLASTPSELSGGMLQRLLFATALLMTPRVVVLDEPTASLDSQALEEVVRAVALLKQSGVAVIMITHDLTVAQRLADRVWVVQGGVLVESGSAAMLTHPQHPYTETLVRASRLKAAALARWQHPSENQGELHD
ncbi:MAG: ATP-binding cassette domain-containing protein [Sutterella sp.]|nr:ATP-binding cassette domain-containing protein [Sutterella sp.]